MLSRQIFVVPSRNVRKTICYVKYLQDKGTAKRQANFFSTSSTKKEIFAVQNEDEFQTKIMADGNIPTIVEFSASWCGPCNILTPRLDAAVQATNGRVNLAFVDIDNLSELSLDYNIQSIPTVLAVKDGKVVDKFIGTLDETNLGAFVIKLMENI